MIATHTFAFCFAWLFLAKKRRQQYKNGYNGIRTDRLDLNEEATFSLTAVLRLLWPERNMIFPGRDFAIVPRGKVENYLLASAVTQPAKLWLIIIRAVVDYTMMIHRHIASHLLEALAGTYRACPHLSFGLRTNIREDWNFRQYR